MEPADEGPAKGEIGANDVGIVDGFVRPRFRQGRALVFRPIPGEPVLAHRGDRDVGSTAPDQPLRPLLQVLFDVGVIGGSGQGFRPGNAVVEVVDVDVRVGGNKRVDLNDPPGRIIVLGGRDTHGEAPAGGQGRGRLGGRSGAGDRRDGQRDRRDERGDP